MVHSVCPNFGYAETWYTLETFEGVNVKGESKRGEASLIKPIPPPLIREGDKGGGLRNNLCLT